MASRCEWPFSLRTTDNFSFIGPVEIHEYTEAVNSAIFVVFREFHEFLKMLSIAVIFISFPK